MAGYNYDRSGRSPAQIKRRKRKPSGGPRAGQTKTQPVMAGSKAAANKARAKVKRPVKKITTKKTVKRTSEEKKKITARSNASTKRRGMTVEESRILGLTGTGMRDKAAKLRANKTKREAALKRDREKEAAKIKKAKKIVGGALSVVPAGRAVAAGRAGVKALGGGKATVRTGRRIVDRLKTERQKRKEGRGFEDSYGGIVKKGIKGQRSSVKRRNTIAKNKAASESKRIKTAENAYRRGDITKKELQAIRAEAPKNITKTNRGNVSRADVKRRRGPRAKPKR
tara:strand:+ start:1051 stop:1899 length:849 start_codon:yes stop_codon:yes gene_type:complete